MDAGNLYWEKIHAYRNSDENKFANSSEARYSSHGGIISIIWTEYSAESY